MSAMLKIIRSQCDHREGDESMQIGEVIRKYRKSKNMTQEDMAKRLGVTGPAGQQMGKWRIHSRIFHRWLRVPGCWVFLSLDTLLSFREELTMEEINHFPCWKWMRKLKRSLMSKFFSGQKGFWRSIRTVRG